MQKIVVWLLVARKKSGKKLKFYFIFICIFFFRVVVQKTKQKMGSTTQRDPNFSLNKNGVSSSPACSSHLRSHLRCLPPDLTYYLLQFVPRTTGDRLRALVAAHGMPEWDNLDNWSMVTYDASDVCGNWHHPWMKETAIRSFRLRILRPLQLLSNPSRCLINTVYCAGCGKLDTSAPKMIGVTSLGRMISVQPGISQYFSGISGDSNNNLAPKLEWLSAVFQNSTLKRDPGSVHLRHDLCSWAMKYEPLGYLAFVKALRLWRDIHQSVQRRMHHVPVDHWWVCKKCCNGSEASKGCNADDSLTVCQFIPVQFRIGIRRKIAKCFYSFATALDTTTSRQIGATGATEVTGVTLKQMIRCVRLFGIRARRYTPLMNNTDKHLMECISILRRMVRSDHSVAFLYPTHNGRNNGDDDNKPSVLESMWRIAGNGSSLVRLEHGAYSTKERVARTERDVAFAKRCHTEDPMSFFTELPYVTEEGKIHEMLPPRFRSSKAPQDRQKKKKTTAPVSVKRKYKDITPSCQQPVSVVASSMMAFAARGSLSPPKRKSQKTGAS